MKTIKVIDLLEILLTQKGDIPEYIYFEDYKYEYDGRENDYFCDQLNYFLFMNVLGENLENNLHLSIIIKEEEKEIEKLDVALLGQCDNWLRCPTNKATKQDVELNPYIIDNIRENTLYFQRKINELIDVVNSINKGK